MADPNIPDAISKDALAALLHGRTTLPAVEFRRDTPCELGFLIAMLVQNSAGRGPTKSHLAHALVCLVVTLQHHVATEAAEKIAQIKSPVDALYPIYLTKLVSMLHQMETIGEALLECFHNQYKVDFDGSVSDDFLSSIGVSREDYEVFKSQARLTEQD